MHHDQVLQTSAWFGQTFFLFAKNITSNISYTFLKFRLNAHPKRLKRKSIKWHPHLRFSQVLHEPELITDCTVLFGNIYTCDFLTYCVNLKVQECHSCVIFDVMSV